jgi:uncharacterized protein YjbI with pentapeptide repeats
MLAPRSLAHCPIRGGVKRPGGDAREPRIWRSWFGLLFLWILAAGNAPPAEAQSTPRVLYERDFVADPALAALSKDVVLFDLEPSPRGQPTRTQLARYDLDAGTHTICLDADDPFLTEVVLEDGHGKKLLRLHRPHGPKGEGKGRPKPRKPECAQVTLAAGTYTLRVTHDGGSIAGAHRVAFAQPTSASPSLLDETGILVGGFWALRPDPHLDPLRRLGRVHAPPPDQSVPGTPFTAIRPLLADFTARQIDDAGLFNFANPNDPTVGTTKPIALNLGKLDASGFWTGFADDGPTKSQAFFKDVPLAVTGLGGYRVQLDVERQDGKAANFFLLSTTFSATTLALNYDRPQPDPPPAAVDVLFRFYPDGTQVGTLQEGEIALFQQCDYQGKAAVFALDAPSLGELASAVTTLDKTAASVKLGNNTAVFLNSGPVYTGTRQLVTADTPCLATTPIGVNNTSSILIRPIAPLILLSSRKCEDCLLEGLDLSGLDLSGVDLQRANLTGANLTGVNLKTILLKGAILDQVVGLANSDLSQVLLSNVSLRQVNLSTAKLYGAQLNQADLEGANLGGAFLTNNQGAGISQAASLVGAHLKNVNLAKAQLSGANFSNASFYGTNAAGTGQCAVSNGFTESCATAAGATMNNTQFGGAYLYGVDFTDTTVQGVQFNGAVLIGANFSGATISVDPSVGTNTGFSNAYLQGTSLAGATVSTTSLFNAFLDFRVGGNSMFLLLNEKYSNFPNWPTPGQPICILVAYNSATTVPTTNTTLTCPDGSSAAGGGCGPANAGAPLNPHWASTLQIDTADPPASYLANATYTSAAAPICTDLDVNW